LALFGVSFTTWTPESPEPGDSTAAEIRRYAADNAGAIRLGLFGGLVCVALLVVLVAALIQLARTARPASIVPGVLLLCGAASIFDSMLNLTVMSPYGFQNELDKVPDSTVVRWYDLVGVAEWSGTLTYLVPRMILIVAFSLFALKTRSMARWVSWAGFAIAAVAAVHMVAILFNITALDPTFLIVLFGWWLWPLAVGGALGVRWLRTRPGH
jgi:hypothetical protein